MQEGLEQYIMERALGVQVKLAVLRIALSESLLDIDDSERQEIREGVMTYLFDLKQEIQELVRKIECR